MNVQQILDKFNADSNRDKILTDFAKREAHRQTVDRFHWDGLAGTIIKNYKAAVSREDQKTLEGKLRREYARKVAQLSGLPQHGGDKPETPAAETPTEPTEEE